MAIPPTRDSARRLPRRGRDHRPLGLPASLLRGVSGWSPLAGPQFAGLRGARCVFELQKPLAEGASPGPPHDSARRKDAARHLGRGLARGPRPKRTAGRGAARTPDPVGHCGWGSEGAQPPASLPQGTRECGRWLPRLSVPLASPADGLRHAPHGTGPDQAASGPSRADSPAPRSPASSTPPQPVGPRQRMGGQ